MKKVLCLTMAAAMTLSMTSVGVSAEERTETVTITMGRQTTTNPMLPEGDTYEDNAYIRMAEAELNIDIVDEFEASGEDYDRQVSLTVSAGDMPDIMKVSTMAEVQELYENDMIADLTEVYETYANDRIKYIYGSYGEGVGLDKGKIDGQLVAIPSAKGDTAPMICFVRQDWVDQLGLTIDEDGDRIISYLEIIELSKKFKEADPEGTGNMVAIAAIPEVVWNEGEGAWGLNFISNAMNAWPQTWYEEDGKVVWGSTTEETREFLRYCAELYADGVIDAQFGTRVWDDVTALMTGGQFGFAFGAGHTPFWGLVNVRSLNENAEYSCFLVSDENGVVRHKHSNSAESGFIVVSKDCENPEVAIQLTNLFFGQTNEEYEALKEKYPEVKEYEDVLKVDPSCKPFNIQIGLADEELINQTARLAYFAGEMTLEEVAEASNQGNADYCLTIENWEENGFADSAEWAQYLGNHTAFSLKKTLADYDKAEWVNPLFPTETDTMKMSWANIEAAENELFVKIITGAVGVDEGFDSYLEQFDALGGNTICEEIAAQYGIG